MNHKARAWPEWLLGLQSAFASAALIKGDGWRRTLSPPGRPDTFDADRSRLFWWAERTLLVLSRLPASPWRNTCLYRAVAVCEGCKKLGDPAVMKIGVRRASDLLSAHAWVEDGAGNVVYGAKEKHTYLQSIR